MQGYNKRRTQKSERSGVVTRAASWRLAAYVVLAGVIISSFSGCNGVRRRLTITSEPSGAIVYLNNKEIGKTPISRNFLYSGVYNIKCYKEGYEMKETYYKAGRPWYLYPGIDFFAENFTPGELRDEQSCHITLEQKREIPRNELYENACKLRDEAHNGAIETNKATTNSN